MGLRYSDQSREDAQEDTVPEQDKMPQYGSHTSTKQKEERWEHSTMKTKSPDN